VKIGITGTRSGCTPEQFDKVKHILECVKREDKEFHHGDCVGVDAEIAKLAKTLSYKIICHPPEKDELRAFIPYDECREKFSYFKRNRNIVDEIDHLIIVPYQNEWTSHGGTWYTHDYAKKRNKSAIIVWPNGTWVNIRDIKSDKE
jgi:hypothetical protein